jgi:transporter family-2 protein
MKIQLYLLMVIIGFVLALHLAMNAQVGNVLKNPRVGNAVFWVIGAVTAVLIGISGWEKGILGNLKDVNIILLTAGALGACLVFGIAWLIPQIGAGAAMILMLAGQVVFGLILSHFGWLGSPVQPITFMKIFGAVIMVAGVIIVVK